MPPRESSIADVVDLVENGDTVLLDTSRPRGVGQALAERSGLSDVSVYAFGVDYTDPAPLVALADAEGITVSLSMVPPGVREHLTDGSIEFLPQTLYAVARHPPFTNRGGCTFAILHTPPIDGNAHELGCLTAYGGELVDAADVTVVETNEAVPTVNDGQSVPSEAIDHEVRVKQPLPVLRGGDLRDVERHIAENVSKLVDDGAMVQLGIGRVYPALAEELADRDVSVWTGLISNGVEAMAEGSSVRSITGCSALGTDQEFYEWVCNGAYNRIHLTSVTNTHNPARLQDFDRFIAVNSAFQVDLYGQVNAEMLGHEQLSGVGGQLDFMHAASASPHGQSVIALPARTRWGDPTIVPSVGDGGVVTTPRHCVDAVVTEFGVAVLRDRNTSERVRELCRVAHPTDRERLRRSATDKGLL